MKNINLIKQKLLQFNLNKLYYLLYWILALLLLSILCWQFGLKQFGGFDQSALIDTAWRLLKKQVPYQDFYLTTPVGFYLGAWLGFRLFGAKWSSLVLINIVYIIFTYTLQTLCLNMFISKRYSLGITFSCEALAMIVPSYWWYNSITMMTACMFVSASIAYINFPTRVKSQIFFVISLFLLALMKPNISGLLIPLVIGSLLFLKTRKRTIALVILSIVLFFLLLLIFRINPMDLINSYLGTAQTRGMPQISYFFQDKAGEEYITIPLIILCLIPFVGLIKPLLKNRAKLSSSFSIGIIISLFATIVGFWGFFTNSDSNLVAGLPLIFICPMILLSWVIKNEIIDIQLHPGYSIAVLFSLFAVFIGLTINNVSPFTLPLTITQSILWKACLMIVFTAILFSLLDSRKWSFVLAFMILIISIAAICVGQGRLRVKYIGPFYTDSSLIKIQNIPFFDNYDVSPQLGAVVGDIKLTLAQYNKKDLLQQKIFFGPRIQFAYAAFHINSPTKLPVWFHPGVSYSLQDSQKVIDSFVEHKFDLCIFARYGEGSVDFTYLPGEIINALNRNYKRIDMTGVVVYKLNSNITKEIQ